MLEVEIDGLLYYAFVWCESVICQNIMEQFFRGTITFVLRRRINQGNRRVVRKYA